jgi:hypothetical protein
MNWCSVYITPQGLPKYIYLSSPLIFPTTYNGIRTKNRPVWITGRCSHTLNGTDSQPSLGAKADWGLRYRIYGEMRGCKENLCSNRVQHHFLRVRWLWMNRKMIGEAWQIRCFPYGERFDVPASRTKDRSTAEESRTTVTWSFKNKKKISKLRKIFGHL